MIKRITAQEFYNDCVYVLDCFQVSTISKEQPMFHAAESNLFFSEPDQDLTLTNFWYMITFEEFLLHCNKHVTHCNYFKNYPRSFLSVTKLRKFD